MNKDINSPKSPSPVVRKQWSEQQMLGAINSVQKGHISGNIYGYDMGDWIKCHCEQWIHEECIDYDIKEPFICQKCVL